MTTVASTNTTAVLKQILARDPQASLHKIRRAHPAFSAMSQDQLYMRLTQVIDSQRDVWAK